MAVYRDWDSLEHDIVNKVRLATIEARNRSLERLDEYMRVRFYQTPKPNQYIRTGHLGESAEIGEYIEDKFGATGTFYINDNDYYTTGTYPTPIVFQEAEVQGSGIIGNPYFWHDTMNDMENEIIPNAFRKYFT